MGVEYTMICPMCESDNVIELEQPAEGEYKCLDCGYKFDADEVLEDSELRGKMEDEEKDRDALDDMDEDESEEEEDGGLFI
jgi:transcription initiation factor TFIIIB Brf1 subunit/transcription initiation factor TFIIB